MGQKTTSFIVLRKVSLANPEKKFYKANCQPLPKKNVNPFEIDKNDAAGATPEFPIVDSDHDEDEDIDSDICN